MGSPSFGKIGYGSGRDDGGSTKTKRDVRRSRLTPATIALGVAIPVTIFVLAFLMSGDTISASEACLRREEARGYHQPPTEWDAPMTVIERGWIDNYAERKVFESRLLVCKYLEGEPIVTCGPLKCGGLFSFATEGSEARTRRQQQAEEAELKVARERALEREIEREAAHVRARASQHDSDKAREYPILKRRTCPVSVGVCK